MYVHKGWTKYCVALALRSLRSTLPHKCMYVRGGPSIVRPLHCHIKHYYTNVPCRMFNIVENALGGRDNKGPEQTCLDYNETCICDLLHNTSSITDYKAPNLNVGLLAYSVALVRKETIQTERPPLVGEVSANFLRIEGFLDRSHYFSFK
jgi:hypothetical protein